MRRGAALPMVLLSLGLVAALSIGGSFVTRRFAADAALGQQSADIEPVIEQVLVSSAARLDTAFLAGLPIGGSSSLAPPVEAVRSGMVARAWITRLSATTYVLVCEAESVPKPLFYKRLGVYVRVDSTGVRLLPYRPWSQLP